MKILIELQNSYNIIAVINSSTLLAYYADDYANYSDKKSYRFNNKVKMAVLKLSLIYSPL